LGSIENKMKIIVTVRSLNESANVERFCECYSWADSILLADGGSSDDTIYKALKFDNTRCYKFTEKIWHNNKVFSNPRGKHINFLIRWAEKEYADWIIFDDIDSVPSMELQQHGREILETCNEDMVFAYRLYVKGDDKYYPDANIPGQSLWAWRWSSVWADESNPSVFSMHISNCNRLNLEPPNVLLHYFYPSEELIQKKMEFYGITGDAGGKPKHPDEIFGRIEKLPNWARWK
jgi:glycosyltransferase involved in cell wall biosynthesis